MEMHCSGSRFSTWCFLFLKMPFTVQSSTFSVRKKHGQVVTQIIKTIKSYPTIFWPQFVLLKFNNPADRAGPHSIAMLEEQKLIYIPTHINLCILLMPQLRFSFLIIKWWAKKHLISKDIIDNPGCSEGPYHLITSMWKRTPLYYHSINGKYFKH